MTELKDQGENWALLGNRVELSSSGELQRIVSLTAIANAQQCGAGATLNAYLAACVNVVANCGLDVAAAQELIRAVADQLPEATGAARLNNMPSANAEGRPS